MQKIFFALLLVMVIGWGKRPINANAQSEPKPLSNPEISSGTEVKNADNLQTIASSEKGVNWISFEQAVEKSKTEKRKIFIDVYTDWCGWCKVMDKSTFSDPLISKLLNDKFYAVKLNAEQREEITFDNHVFKFIESGRSGYHQLAAALLNNQMSYPSVVFLDEDFKLIQLLPGYRKAPEFHEVLQYIGEGHYTKQKWEDFQAAYKSPY